jgi:hypothetical protein
MHIAVCVKQVPDTDARLEVRGEALVPHLRGVQPVINPFCEFALEEALRLRDTHGGEVTVVMCDKDPVEDVLFHALAMGADRGIVVVPDRVPKQQAVVRLLADALRGLSPDLILCGEYGVDDEAPVSPMLYRCPLSPQRSASIWLMPLWMVCRLQCTVDPRRVRISASQRSRRSSRAFAASASRAILLSIRSSTPETNRWIHAA